jgi:DNA-binding NarL/FixJ family response regulator
MSEVEAAPRVLRVLIADDNPVIRMGLRILLDPEPDLEVVAEASDGDQAVALAAQHDPDVVLLDVRMPGRGGLEVLPTLVEQACVLMLTSSDEDETIRTALAVGARGYLVYGTVDEKAIVASIRTAARGGSVLSGGLAMALLGPRPTPTAGATVAAELPGPRSFDAPGGVLSEREVAVMDLLAAGRSNAEIAGQLYLAPKTVKNHINRIFAKLQVSTRAQAMAFWLGSAGSGPGPVSGALRDR